MHVCAKCMHAKSASIYILVMVITSKVLAQETLLKGMTERLLVDTSNFYTPWLTMKYSVRREMLKELLLLVRFKYVL